MIEKLREALRRLHQFVGDQIDFDGGDAHARIVGIQGLKNEMEELVGVFQMAAPGVQILVNQPERLVGAVQGKFKEALGLLLWRHVTDGFEVGVWGAGIGSRNERVRPLRCKRQQGAAVKPLRRGKLTACCLKAGGCRKSCEQEKGRDVAKRAIRSYRMPVIGLGGPGNVFR